METDEVLRILTAPSAAVRTAGTFKLDYGDFCDPRIRDAVRANLEADDPDLLEITIIRLLIRGKDVHSADRVRLALASTRDDLVFAAAVGALTNLAHDRPETARATLAALDGLRRSQIPADRLAMFENARRKLRDLCS